MRPEIVIAVVSAVVSLVSVLVTAVAAYRTTVIGHRLQEQARERTRAELAEELFRHYREPLLWSAQSLQSRLFNGIERGFLRRYLHCGDQADERYVRDNTVYVLAEYLGWLEIIRRDQRLLDLETIGNTKELFRAIADTSHILATEGMTGPFRLFRGQQRAIGELMVNRSELTNGATHEVLGYASFCQRLDEDPQFAAWFDRLRLEVETIESEGKDGNERLVHLQSKLIDLIDVLDPDGDRLPRPQRARLPKPRLAVQQLTTNEH
jgi:hypothetical protein